MIHKLNYKLTRVFSRLSGTLKKEYYKYIFFKNVQKVGTDVEITGEIKVVNNAGLTVGSKVTFGNNIEVSCHGGVIICDNVTIEDDCRIISSYPICKNNSEPSYLSELPGSIIIGEGSYIGKGSLIRTGIEIPPHSVIPPYSVIKQVSDLKILNSEATVEENRSDRISVLKKYEEFPDEIVFVFSTGRSGSNAIENLGNKNPRINAYHEPFYAQLKVLAFNYCAGFISEEEAKIALIKIYKTAPITGRKNIYLESDQKLVPFISIISQIFPKAKLIWLIRSPQSFLKSAKARGWFLNDYPNVLDQNVLITPEMMSDACRITGDFTGDFTKEEWLRLSHEDKILWYWKYWNGLIESQLKAVSNKKMLLKLENINESTQSFFEFISGEYSPDWNPEVTNQVKKKHQKSYSTVKNDKIQKHDLEDLKKTYSNLDKNVFQIDTV